MRSRLLSLTLLAALTLAASNQFGGGSFGGASAGRVNRAPVAVATGAERAGPGTVQLDGSASTDEGIVGGGFPSSLSYVWTDPYDPDGVCEITAGQLTDTVTVTMSNDTGCCMMNLFVSDGRRSDAMDVLACVTEDTPPSVSVSMQPVAEGGNFTISGSATDDSDCTCATCLTCEHTMIQAPAGDAGTYSDASAEDPTYGVVAAGGYENQFCVTDDSGENPPVCDTTGVINVASSGATCVPEAAGFAHFDCFADDPFAAGRWSTGSTAIEAGLITAGWPDAWTYDSEDEEICLAATGSAVRGAAVYLTDLASVDPNACFEVTALPSGGTWNFGHLIRAGDVDDDFRTYYPRVNESSEIVWESFDELDIFQTVNGPAAQSISVGDVFCARVTGEAGNESRTAHFDATYPADADPTTWTAEHTFTTPDGTVSSGLTVGVRGFLSAGTTGELCLADWGAGSTEPEGPPEEAVLTLTPTSVSRSMEEGETVLDALFQVCNEGNVVLDDWEVAVQGTPDDITDDSDAPNSSWLGASDSGTDLAPDTCENVTATITGEENGDPGSYSGTVRASTNDVDSTVAFVDRTVSLLINEVGTGDITANLVCEGPTNKVAPVVIHCDAIDTVHESPSVDTFHDLHYSWTTSGCGEVGTWGESATMGGFAHAHHQKFSKNTYEGGPIFAAIGYAAGTCTISVTARDVLGNTDTDTFQFTITDPDTVFSGTSTECLSNDGDFTGCPSGATQTTTSSCGGGTYGANRRVLLERGDTFSGQCFSQEDGPGIAGAFGTGSRPVVTIGSGTAFSRIKSGWRIMDVEVTGSTGGVAFDLPSGAGTGGPAEDVLLLRVHADGVEGLAANNESPRFAAVESIFENSRTPENCSYNLFAEMDDRSAFINVATDDSKSCHNFRVPSFNRLFIAYSQGGIAQRGNWRFHSDGSGDVSRYAVVGYTAGPSMHMNFGTSSGGSGGVANIQDVIVENSFIARTTGSPIQCGMDRMTVRNNVLRGSLEAMMQVRLRNPNTNPFVRECRFLHNTIHYTGSGDAVVAEVLYQNGASGYDGPGVVKGNLLYAPSASTVASTDGDPGFSTDANRLIDDSADCPFDTCPTPGSTNVTDYDPDGSDGTVIGQGFTMTVDEAVFRDLENTPRSNPADVGAMED